MKKRILLGCAFSTALAFSSFAQADSTQVTTENTEEIIMDDVFDMSLEDLLNMEISVGGSNKLTLRETPGIITVITEREIKTSGARDLVDLLRTVPGFEFSGDIENTIGLGVRGNHAQEGKTLLLIDGQEINETGYGTIVFGNRFFTDNIQKIEIIRGPGSAVYGGMAELAVINVITKTGEDLDGGFASTTYGTSNGTQSRLNGQFGVGKKLDNGLNISLTGSYSEANRSNETIDYATDYNSDDGDAVTQNFADSSLVKNIDLNLGLKYKGLSLTSIYQDHSIEYNAPGADWLKFGGLYLGGKYDWEVNDKLTITPQVNWKKVAPWTYQGNVNEDTEYYVIDSYRSSEKLTAFYKLNENIKFTTGAEAYQDRAVKTIDGSVFANDKNSVSYSNVAAFGEVLVANKVANFIVGARYDKHSQFGDAFVPRFAVTKVIDQWHFKGLLSRAFKAPVINNFEVNEDIKPEFTNVSELEVGYQINDHMVITANGFLIKITDPIVYGYDPESDEEFYFNLGTASTIGAELDFKINYDWGYINSSYSFYKNNNTEVKEHEFYGDEHPYVAQSDKSLLRGFPAHKVVVTSGIDINDKIIVAPSFIFNSKKVGLYSQEEFWEKYEDADFDPNLIFNLAIHYEPIENLRISLGAYDILSQKYTTANAYDAGYQGTPTMGQEFTIKAAYQF